MNIDNPKPASESVIHTRSVLISVIGGVWGVINVLGLGFFTDDLPEDLGNKVEKFYYLANAIVLLYGAKLGLEIDQNYLAKGTRWTPKGKPGADQEDANMSVMMSPSEFKEFVPQVVSTIDATKKIKEILPF